MKNLLYVVAIICCSTVNVLGQSPNLADINSDSYLTDYLVFYMLDMNLEDDEIIGVDLLVIDEIMEKYNLKYLFLKERKDEIYLKRSNNKAKEWDVIVQRNEYFILCPENYGREICKCKDNIYIFVPEKNLLRSIHPWYAAPFFTKKRLLKTINENTSEHLNTEDFEKYCDLIHYLRNE